MHRAGQKDARVRIAAAQFSTQGVGEVFFDGHDEALQVAGEHPPTAQ
jgi:hypothetical protein